MSKDDLLSKLAKKRNTPLNQIKRLSASRAKDDRISGEGYAMLVKRAEEEEQRKKRGNVVKSALMPFVPTTIGKMAFNEYHARYGGTTGMLVKGAESPSATHVFSPIDIADLISWFAADKITGLNDLDAISTWVDNSGAVRNVIQNTAANKPLYRTNIINGKPIVRFDGVNDFLLNSSPNFPVMVGITMFVVGTRSGAPPFGIFINGQDGVNELRWNAAGTTPQFAQGSSAATWTAPVTGFHLYQGEYEVGTTTLRFRLDGSTAITNTDPDLRIPTQISIGARSTGAIPLNGDIAEILEYSRILTINERQQIENYLITKYAL